MATWKKVLVSGSSIVINQVNVGDAAGVTQQITGLQTTTRLTGSFSGSFTGDGSGLTGVGAGTVESITAGTGLTGGTITGTGTIAIDTSVVATLASPTFTGTVGGISKSMVGLGNVDNTSNATERAAVATLSNKTLTTPIISSISNTGTLTLPTSTDTLVGRDTTDTLTNKTLTTPIIGGTGATFNGSTSGTTKLKATAVAGITALTLPAATDTLVGKATTDTLTNKTIDGDLNTITNVDLASGVTGILPASNGGTGLTSLGTNVATFLGTPSSANLASALTDKTGTGVNVFATSPTLTTPTLGVAAATSINKVTITAPATSATLTIVNGGSLITAGAYSTTLTSTATTNVTLPTTGTLATLAGTETLSGKTLTTPNIGAATGTSLALSDGNLAINNGTSTAITTTGGTAAVFNTTATTVNAFGAATTLNIGGGSGTTTVGNSLVVTGDLTVNGDLTTINTANLAVEDKFILLASGSATAGDGGIIIDRGSDAAYNIGYGYDSTTGRWGYQNLLQDTTTALDPTSGNGVNGSFAGYVFTEASHTATKPTTGEFAQLGSIYTANSGDIFIFS
jgi:hypothetical protein